MRELTETKILDSLNNMINVLKENVSDMLEIMEEREKQVQDLNNQIYEIEKQLESHNWGSFLLMKFTDSIREIYKPYNEEKTWRYLLTNVG